MDNVEDYFRFIYKLIGLEIHLTVLTSFAQCLQNQSSQSSKFEALKFSALVNFNSLSQVIDLFQIHRCCAYW